MPIPPVGAIPAPPAPIRISASRFSVSLVRVFCSASLAASRSRWSCGARGVCAGRDGSDGAPTPPAVIAATWNSCHVSGRRPCSSMFGSNEPVSGVCTKKPPSPANWTVMW